MGLDSVELVIATEDEFQIEISDEQAEAVHTVGDLHHLVIHLLEQSGHTNLDSINVFERVRQIVVEQLNAPTDQVTQSARFVEDLKMDV